MMKFSIRFLFLLIFISGVFALAISERQKLQSEVGALRDLAQELNNANQELRIENATIRIEKQDAEVELLMSSNLQLSQEMEELELEKILGR